MSEDLNKEVLIDRLKSEIELQENEFKQREEGWVLQRKMFELKWRINLFIGKDPILTSPQFKLENSPEVVVLRKELQETEYEYALLQAEYEEKAFKKRQQMLKDSIEKNKKRLEEIEKGDGK